MPLILTDLQMRTMLADLTATGGSFDPAVVRVAPFASIATVVPIGDTAMSDVTQATGAVATRVVVTAWSGPYQLPDGRWAVDGPLCSFTPASSGEAQSVAGWMYCTLATAGVLLAWSMFGNPIGLVSAFTPLQLIPRLTIDPQGNWDATVQVAP